MFQAPVEDPLRKQKADELNLVKGASNVEDLLSALELPPPVETTASQPPVATTR